jgi:hypothetical protein
MTVPSSRGAGGRRREVTGRLLNSAWIGGRLVLLKEVQLRAI